MLESKAVRTVLIIPSWYPSEAMPKNGIFIQDQARALARRLKVAVLTPRFPGIADQVRLRWGPDLIRTNEGRVDTWHIRKLKLPTLRRFVPGGFFGDHAMVYARKFAAAIRDGFTRYVRQCGLPDIIHAHVVLPAGWIAVDLAKQVGVPIVLTEHSGPFAMHLTSARQERLVREVLRGADRVAAVSPSLRQTMQAFCPGVPIDVIGNLVDTEYYVPAPRPSNTTPFRFFYLGTLTENKGVPFLLQAARILLERGLRGFTVHLGGDGPLRAALEKTTAELGLANHCRCLGMLDPSAVREQMQACDVFVLPSLGETFGIVLGEAMACGKPVLSTQCGGPEYVVTPETGLLVPTADAPALADAMARFLNRAVAFDAQRIRASVVERFGTEAFLDATERLYADTIDFHHRNSAGETLN